MFIDGKKIETDKKINIYNPYNKKLVGNVSLSNEEFISLAINNSANLNLNLTVKEKKTILSKTAIELGKNQHELANLISLETGLSLKDSSYEISRVINCANYSIKCCEKINQDQTFDFILDETNYPELEVISEPIGLVFAITPFNHPMNQVAHKIFPAIIAGAPVILKPSEKAPLSAIKLVEILTKNGLPKNMINVLTGKDGKSITESVLSDPRISMVTFTGGLLAGIDIKKTMILKKHYLTKYVPELGGSSSLIVCDDGNLDDAAEIIMNGCFKNSGQRCTSTRRVVVENNVADLLIGKVLNKLKNLNFGNPFDKKTDVGTVIDEDAAIKIQERVNDAVKFGAKVLFGNIREGALYSPTLVDNVSLNMDLISHETFGPICPIIRTKSLEESIEIAKTTKYKLAGAVVTSDEIKARKVCKELSVGQFSLNGPPSYRTEVAPFGGFGNSGNGEKEGILLAARGMRRMRTFYRH